MNKLIKITIGLVLGATAYGATTVADNQINPYIDKGDRQEISTIQDIPEAGESKIELLKSRPEMRLKKWNGEVDLGVSYSKVKGQGDRPLLSNKIEWKDTKEEVHAYPIDNDNFEFEVVLKEKPDTNIFDFQIDGYENLDFFYQPTLTQKEIDEGAFRPDDVIGSYAVYHKDKKNHIEGQTNYATGKVFHIYRPKAIDANGIEQWAELSYQNGILRVTVSQGFLDNAIYPVRIDPTFGYTTAGASLTLLENSIKGSRFTATENGTGSSMSWYMLKAAASTVAKANIYSSPDSTPNPITNGSTNEATLTPSTSSWETASFTSAPSFVVSTEYLLVAWAPSVVGSQQIYYDVGSAGQGTASSLTYGTWPDPLVETDDTNKYSIYATYTAAGGASTPSITSDIIFFE